MTSPSPHTSPSSHPSNTKPQLTVSEQLKRYSDRLHANKYSTDEAHSHIHIDQQQARITGCGPMLTRVCPAHVYSMGDDGEIYAEYAACVECGTCKAVAPPGVLSWHYPRSAKGIEFRHG